MKKASKQTAKGKTKTSTSMPAKTKPAAKKASPSHVPQWQEQYGEPPYRINLASYVDKKGQFKTDKSKTVFDSSDPYWQAEVIYTLIRKRETDIAKAPTTQPKPVNPSGQFTWDSQRQKSEEERLAAKALYEAAAKRAKPEVDDGEAEDGQPAKAKKEKPEPKPGVERDEFGVRASSQAGQINAYVLASEGKTITIQSCAKAIDCSTSRVKAHYKWLVQRGHLKATEGGYTRGDGKATTKAKAAPTPKTKAPAKKAKAAKTTPVKRKGGSKQKPSSKTRPLFDEDTVF